MTRRLWSPAPLALVLLVVEMARHFLGVDLLPFLAPRDQQYLQLALAAPAVLWGGWPFFVRGYRSLRTGNLNMFTLIAIGIGAAFLYSLVAVFAPDIFPAEMRDHHGLVGGLFRGGGGDHRAGAGRPGAGAAGPGADQRRDPRPPRPRAEDRAAGSAPTATPRRCRWPRSRSATCSASGPATRCRSTASSSTARSAIDEALVTGEPIPVEKHEDDRVTGGTQNTTGSFDMKVDRTGAETTLSRIVAMVAEAQRSRAPIQGLADRVSAIFVPAVIAVAVVAFVLLAGLRPVAGARLCAGRRGQRADHRLPLRARPRHADLDHGRDRPRRPGGPPHPQRRGAGADGLGRHASSSTRPAR